MTDEDLRPLVRKLVANPLSAPLSREEQDVIGSLLQGSVRDEGDHLCSSCQVNIPGYTVLGQVIADEVQCLLDDHRKKEGSVVSWPGRGEVSVIDWPSGYRTCRIIEGEPEDLEWRSYDATERVYPREFYLGSSLLFQDKELHLGSVSIVSALRKNISKLLSDTILMEKELTRSDGNTLRHVVVRKSLDSRFIDTYNLGRAAHGWWMESIVGIVEFL